MLSPNGRKLLLPLILIGLIIPLAFIWFIGWPEPDSYYFYNAVCSEKWEGTPELAQQLFTTLLDCNLFQFKLAHLIFIFAILSSIYFCLKKLNHSGLIWLIGFHGFTLAFLSGFEDDLLVMPLLIVLGFHIIEKKSHTGLALTLIFLCSLIWKGALVWFGIFLGWALFPPLALISVIAYLLVFGVSAWGGAGEAIIGGGFLLHNFLLYIVLYKLWKNPVIWKENKPILWLLLSTLVLTFFQPKWGLITLIPELYLLSKVWVIETHQLELKAVGFFFGILFFSYFVIAYAPTAQIWSLVDEYNVLHENGFKTYNDWGTKRWIEFKGGTSTGTVGTTTIVNDTNYYYLGLRKTECSVISSTQNLFLQYCP